MAACDEFQGKKSLCAACSRPPSEHKPVERIHAGFLEKTGDGDSKYQKRWFVLDTVYLKYYASETEKQLKGDIRLSKVISVEQVPASANFAVTIVGRVFNIRAASNADAARWCQLIRAQVATIPRANTLSSSTRSGTITSTHSPSVSLSSPAPVSVSVPPTATTSAASPARSGTVSSSSSDARGRTVSSLSLFGRRGTTASSDARHGGMERMLTGYLEKTGENHSSFQKRWFVLDAVSLRYFENDTEKSLKGEIDATRIVSITAHDYSPLFEVSVADRTYQLRAHSPEEAVKWCTAIQGLVSPDRRESTASVMSRVIVPDSRADDEDQDEEADALPRLRQGFLEKTGETHDRYQKRWFVLDSSKLSYYSGQDEKSLKSHIFLADVTGLKPLEASAYFDLETRSGRTYKLKAGSMADARDWCAALTDVIPALARARKLSSASISDARPAITAIRAAGTLDDDLVVMGNGTARSFTPPPPLSPASQHQNGHQLQHQHRQQSPPTNGHALRSSSPFGQSSINPNGNGHHHLNGHAADSASCSMQPPSDPHPTSPPSTGTNGTSAAGLGPAAASTRLVSAASTSDALHAFDSTVEQTVDDDVFDSTASMAAAPPLRAHGPARTGGFDANRRSYAPELEEDELLARQMAEAELAVAATAGAVEPVDTVGPVDTALPVGATSATAQGVVTNGLSAHQDDVPLIPRHATPSLTPSPPPPANARALSPVTDAVATLDVHDLSAVVPPRPIDLEQRPLVTAPPIPVPAATVPAVVMVTPIPAIAAVPVASPTVIEPAPVASPSSPGAAAQESESSDSSADALARRRSTAERTRLMQEQRQRRRSMPSRDRPASSRTAPAAAADDETLLSSQATMEGSPLVHGVSLSATSTATALAMGLDASAMALDESPVVELDEQTRLMQQELENRRQRREQLMKTRMRERASPEIVIPPMEESEEPDSSAPLGEHVGRSKNSDVTPRDGPIATVVAFADEDDQVAPLPLFTSPASLTTPTLLQQPVSSNRTRSLQRLSSEGSMKRLSLAREQLMRLSRDNADLESELSVTMTENSQLRQAVEALESDSPSSLLVMAEAQVYALSVALEDARTMVVPEAGPPLNAMLRTMMKQALQDSIDASTLHDRLLAEHEALLARKASIPAAALAAPEPVVSDRVWASDAQPVNEGAAFWIADESLFKSDNGDLPAAAASSASRHSGSVPPSPSALERSGGHAHPSGPGIRAAPAKPKKPSVNVLLSLGLRTAEDASSSLHPATSSRGSPASRHAHDSISGVYPYPGMNGSHPSALERTSSFGLASVSPPLSHSHSHSQLQFQSHSLSQTQSRPQSMVFPPTTASPANTTSAPSTSPSALRLSSLPPAPQHHQSQSQSQQQHSQHSQQQQQPPPPSLPSTRASLIRNHQPAAHPALPGPTAATTNVITQPRLTRTDSLRETSSSSATATAATAAAAAKGGLARQASVRRMTAVSRFMND